MTRPPKVIGVLRPAAGAGPRPAGVSGALRCCFLRSQERVDQRLPHRRAAGPINTARKSRIESRLPSTFGDAVPLKGGRYFTDADRDGAPKVVLINESLAKLEFHGQNPLGQQIAFERTVDTSTVWMTIVGVVGDEHQTTLADLPQIEVFQPLHSAPTPT